MPLTSPVEAPAADKLRALISAILGDTRHVPAWLRQGLLAQSPLDLALPWFSYPAIRYLKEMDLSGKVVAEYGGGGSTLFFAQHAARIVTVENDPQWATELRFRLAASEIHNVDVLLREARFTTANDFMQSPFAEPPPVDTGPFDIVVIDSFDYFEGHPLRPLLFKRTQDWIRPGSMIILDDAHRYPQVAQFARSRRHVSFPGLGPGRRTATRTDIYWY